MKNTTNASIAALAVSAAILAGVLILMNLSTPAYAGTSPATGGEYIMIPGKVSSSRDALYIFDLAAQKMNVYTYNFNGQVLQLDDQLDLKKAFRG